MGTKIHCKSYLPAYHSMRDLNEDSSSSSWPVCYGDKSATNGQYYNGYVPRTMIDLCPGNNKDALKQKMLEHEAVFKDQVYELHRLYRRQRDMMEEVRINELNRLRESTEQSSSSSLRGPQVPTEDARKWHMAGFPLPNSPMSCTKGTTQQPCQNLYQNGSISKESEVLGTRPMKVRKKLFDLQLPADECINLEEGEKLSEVKGSDVSSYSSNANLRIDLERSRKLSLGNHAGSEPDCRIVASSSASRLRNSTGLADLNEPIVVEEAIAPSPPGFFSHNSINGGTKGTHQSDKLNTGHIGVNEEATHIRNGFLIDSVESKVNESRHGANIYEAGSDRSNLCSSNHGFQKDELRISSHPGQGMFIMMNHPHGNYPSDHCRDDPWRVGSHHSSYRSRDCTANSHLEPHGASQAHGSVPFFGSCLSSSWPVPASSWTKRKSSSTQKITALEPSSSMSQVPFGGNWRTGSSIISYQHLGGERTMVNGFYQGSTSGSKDLKAHLSSGFDYHNLKVDNIASTCVNNGFGNFQKGSSHVDSKPVLDINLNEAAVLQDPGSRAGKGKPEDHLPTLPWLKHKPADADSVTNAGKSEALGNLSNFHASSDRLCGKTETIRDLNQPVAPKVAWASSDDEVLMKKEIVSETHNIMKILGVPVFETGTLGEKPSPNVSASASVGCVQETNGADNGRKRRIIDINLECEPEEEMLEEELTAEKEKRAKVTSNREYIDLNSCVSDCEDPLAPFSPRQAADAKTTLEIDLEAPIVLDENNNVSLKQDMACEVSLQGESEELNDKVVKNAAKAMVAISLFCPQEESIFYQPEASLVESLLWFADALSNELETASSDELMVGDALQNDFSKEIDEFEAMTLQLQETKEEDYLLEPFVPEIQKAEETGANVLSTKSRRGQSRRGRQRRDFQRDILPGLATLSRHEVTEDLQTFTGLMRATGHYWTSGLTRRNGTKTRGARGRRRAVAETVPAAIPSPACTPLVQQLNNIETGLEDRSLTGWGKTTRRPRRQRCPAGHPLPVVLT